MMQVKVNIKLTKKILIVLLLKKLFQFHSKVANNYAFLKDKYSKQN